MISKIDWVSFSLKLDLSGNGGVGELTEAMAAAFRAHDEQLIPMLELDGDLIPTKGRKPYSLAWKHPSAGITLYGHPNMPHCLVEVSGTGCSHLEQRGVLAALIQSVKDRCTRIDVATDMLCDTAPPDFVDNRNGSRFKSYSQVESLSGSTYYVGSRSSDRYARVYRYNPPHERAHLLRCEVVSKGKQAKGVADMLTRQSAAQLASEFGKKFGWAHPVWQPDVESSEELLSWRPERHAGKSLFWVQSQVLPALLKLHREGELDLPSWWAEFVEPKL